MYNSDECKELTQDLSNVIKKRVKELGFRRYKILCYVVIGQNVDQGADGTSRCLWDASVDTVATANFKTVHCSRLQTFSVFISSELCERTLVYM